MRKLACSFLSAVFILVLQCGIVPQIAEAQFGGNSFNNPNVSTRDLERQTDRLVQGVQIFLQSNGRWFPQPKGQDMNLCYALHDFKTQLDDLKRNMGGNNFQNAQFKLGQLSNNLRGVHSLIQQIGAGPAVEAQYQSVANALMTVTNAYRYSTPMDPIPWQPSQGYVQPGFNPFGPQFLSAVFQPPNSVLVRYNDRGGRSDSIVSPIDSYMIVSGSRSRPAQGEEVAMLSTAYEQVREQNGAGVAINIVARGNGMMMLAGQQPISLESVQIVSPQWSQDVQVVIVADNGQSFQLMGTLSNYGRSGFGINIKGGGGMGASGGKLRANVSSGNVLYSLSGTGVMNGMPFQLQFNR